MQDDCVCEIEAIPAVDTLPIIASPAGALGARPLGSPPAPEPFRLADAHPFHIDLGHGPTVAGAEPPLEQGKRRG